MEIFWSKLLTCLEKLILSKYIKKSIFFYGNLIVSIHSKNGIFTSPYFLKICKKRFRNNSKSIPKESDLLPKMKNFGWGEGGGGGGGQLPHLSKKSL
jgi:hypothetical protein